MLLKNQKIFKSMFFLLETNEKEKKEGYMDKYGPCTWSDTTLFYRSKSKTSGLL